MRKTTVPLLALLAACGSADSTGVGNVTKSEAEALAEAAEMIEQGRPELPHNSEDTVASASNGDASEQ